MSLFDHKQSKNTNIVNDHYLKELCSI